MLIKQKMELIKCYIVDVDLFIFGIKDFYGKTVITWIAEEVIVKGGLDWRKKRGVVSI